MKWHPEVQRAVAESWSSVLRRLKKNERTRCIHMMMRSLDDSNYNSDEIGDFVAWSLVHTTKVSLMSILVNWDVLNMKNRA